MSRGSCDSSSPDTPAKATNRAGKKVVTSSPVGIEEHWYCEQKIRQVLQKIQEGQPLQTVSEKLSEKLDNANSTVAIMRANDYLYCFKAPRLQPRID